MKTSTLAGVEITPKTERLTGEKSMVRKAMEVIGLSGLLLAGTEAYEVSQSRAAAVETLRAEETPVAIASVHEKLAKQVKADEIAQFIASAPEDELTHQVTDLAVFGQERVEGDTINVDGKRYIVKIGTSEEGDKHYVVVDRDTKTRIDPRLVGFFDAGDDLSIEEGQLQALQNAAANLTEAEGEQIAGYRDNDSRLMYAAVSE